MKIWWPWRRKTVVLSLFEERVPWLGEDRAAVPLNLRVERSVHSYPHPRNAPDEFYVAHGECITCGVPHTVAPDLMGWDDDLNQPGSHNHCYFKTQPSEPGELKQAVDAIAVSCCGALYYSGSDPEVLRKLRKSGNSHAIVNPDKG